MYSSQLGLFVDQLPRTIPEPLLKFSLTLDGVAELSFLITNGGYTEEDCIRAGLDAGLIREWVTSLEAAA